MTTPPTAKPARILIIEDDSGTRAMLAALFGGTPGFGCAGAVASIEAAQRLRAECCDLVLLDLELPGKSGTDWLIEHSTRNPQLPVVVLTWHHEPEWIFGALAAGAIGYLIKPSQPAKIVEAVQEALDGGAPMSGAIARLVLKEFRQHATHKRDLESLTRQENKVLQLTSEGLLPEDIAAQLGVTRRTVSTHLHRIYQKLHVATRSQAVALYWQGSRY